MVVYSTALCHESVPYEEYKLSYKYFRLSVWYYQILTLKFIKRVTKHALTLNDLKLTIQKTIRCKLFVYMYIFIVLVCLKNCYLCLNVRFVLKHAWNFFLFINLCFLSFGLSVLIWTICMEERKCSIYAQFLDQSLGLLNLHLPVWFVYSINIISQ